MFCILSNTFYIVNGFSSSPLASSPPAESNSDFVDGDLPDRYAPLTSIITRSDSPMTMRIFRPSLTSRRFMAPVFSLDGPEGWTDETVHTFAGPVADGLRHTITVVRDPAPETSLLSDYTHFRRCEVEVTFPDSKLLLEDNVTLQDGRSAGRFVVCYPDPGDPTGSRREYLCVCVLTQMGGFVLSSTFTPASRREIGAEVETVMRSFSLEHGRP